MILGVGEERERSPPLVADERLLEVLQHLASASGRFSRPSRRSSRGRCGVDEADDEPSLAMACRGWLRVVVADADPLPDDREKPYVGGPCWDGDAWRNTACAHANGARRTRRARRARWGEHDGFARKTRPPADDRVARTQRRPARSRATSKRGAARAPITDESWHRRQRRSGAPALLTAASIGRGLRERGERR